MAQLSRPYQIGLAAVAVLAAAWLLLLRPHPSSTSSVTPAPTTSAAVRTVTAPTAAPKAARPSKGSGSSSIYQGSAPGVQGLSRAIAKANGAVATSQQNAKQLEEKSTQASSAIPSTATSAPSAVTTTSQKTVPAVKTSAPSPAKPLAPSAGSHSAAVARQRGVEAQLAKGRVVVILFWDPKGAVDVLVHSALRSLRSQRGLNIDVQEASAHAVASFGTITRGVQVYGTPTVLVLDKEGRAKTITGLQDAYSITQAIREVRHP